jgi:hypothetical protein
MGRKPRPSRTAFKSATIVTTGNENQVPSNCTLKTGYMGLAYGKACTGNTSASLGVTLSLSKGKIFKQQVLVFEDTVPRGSRNRNSAMSRKSVDSV